MPYTQDEDGRINNFAVEPKIYQAEPPTGDQKRNYIILGVAGFLLVSGLVFVAATIS